MKKIFIILLSALFIAHGVNAQAYKGSKYYNPKTRTLDYNRKSFVDTYCGLRIGPAFTHVSSDVNIANNSKTGLNVGFVYGIGLTHQSPLYLETGINYVEKGGKGSTLGQDMSYNLAYLQLPFVVKYNYDTDIDISLQPFFGGYLGCGVGGKTKNYTTRTATDSFDGTDFRRFDAGLRFGLGLEYDMLYVELAYDLGLSNISDNAFDNARNRALMLNFGVNF